MVRYCYLLILLLCAANAHAVFISGIELPVNTKPGGGTAFTDPTTGMEFVLVKGGCFQMGDTFGEGDSDEKPVHEVCVNDYYLGRFEVTQGQWQKVMGSNPATFKSGDRYPVESVNWNDAQDFIRKLNQQPGRDFRLPTEAEWEYAARSDGRAEKYAGGDNVDAVAWYDGNSGGKTHPVGEKTGNGLGLFDMSGNVREWVLDWYGGSYYAGSPRNNPSGSATGSTRVIRGGSWSCDPRNVRSAVRFRCSPSVRGNGLGFRVAFPPVQ